MNTSKKPIKQNFLSNNNLFALLYLFLAWSLAVTQPLMSVFSNQPVFLIAHDVRGWLFVGLTLAFNFIPPFALWLAANILGLISKYLKEFVVRLGLVFLLFLFIVQMLGSLPLHYAFYSSVILAVLCVYLLVKLEILRTFAQWFSLAGFIFIFSFLFLAPSKQLLPSFKTIKNQNKATSDNPVFVIILDEFPLLALLKDSMKIDESRFPTFSKLSKEATWYPNATAVSSATELAIPAIISGVKPSLKEVRMGTYEQYPDNLFTLFSNTHKIHAIENSTRMCPSHLCQNIIKNSFKLLLEDVYISYLYIIYPQDTKHKLPPINDRWIGFMREMKNEQQRKYDFSERLSKFETFYSSFKQYPKNTLHFLHVLLPHAPWTILPNLKLYGFYERDGVPGELDKTKNKTQFNHQWSNDNWATELSWRRELLQIGGVDSLVKNMLNEIKKQGLYDDAIIVITADHGAAFIPSISRRYAHANNIADIARIPLFVKYPHQKQGKIDHRNATSLDILPTLLNDFSIEASDKLDGSSLLSGFKEPDQLGLIQEKFVFTPLPDNQQQEFKKRIKDKNALFSKAGWQGIYHPKGSELFYNKNISTLNIEKHVPNAIKLKNSNLFKTVKKENQYIPVYYRLTKQSEEIKNREILVSVNGVLASHCYFFVHNENDCAGLIDPEMYQRFSDLPINLQFFTVKGIENNIYTVDELLDSNAIKAHIINKNGNEFIQFDNDDVKQIQNKGAPYGMVTLRLIENGSTYRIDGWAGDTISGDKASKVLTFIDGELTSVTDTGVPKNYLFTRYGSKALINSGFQVSVPEEQYPTIQNHKIRVFATMDNTNYKELNYNLSPQHELFAAFDTTSNRSFPLDVNAILMGKLKLAGIKNVQKQSVLDAFNDVFDLISAGDWFAVSKHKRWIGETAYIKMPIDKDVRKLQLSILAKPLIYKNINSQQRMKIYINNKLIDEISFTKKEQKHITLDTAFLKEAKSILLRFEFPDAVSPNAQGKGIDPRKLSLLLYDFTIKSTSS